jgi:hypothetical protein
LLSLPQALLLDQHFVNQLLIFLYPGQEFANSDTLICTGENDMNIKVFLVGTDKADGLFSYEALGNPRGHL